MASRILRVGAKGEDVRDLQRKLKAFLFDPGAQDGFFGPQTEAAVRAFQASNRLVQDGVVGLKTWKALLVTLIEPGLPRPAPAAKYKNLAEVVANLEEGTVAFYEACYQLLQFDPGTQRRVETAANRVSGAMWSQYQELERRRGIPAVMTALIHSMECNNNPKGVLHNGQPIIGTGLKTTIVPKGRGPFGNWMEAALDAVDSVTLWRVPEWSVGWILKQCERFNGPGYINGAGRDEISPYLWACTNINDDYGKYTSDGRFDPRAPANSQVGSAAILKQLELWGKVKLSYSTVNLEKAA